jgi:flagellar biosynthesis protein FlhF
MEGNTVKLKTYQAYTMSEALAAVRRDLGGEAVILNTRTFKRGGMLGLGRRLIVEVTAGSTPRPAVEPPVPATPATPSAPSGPTKLAGHIDEPASPNLPVAPSATAKRFILTPPTIGSGNTQAPQAEAQPSDVAPEVRADLAAIRSMVGRVLQQQAGPARSAEPSLPPALFDQFLALTNQELCPDLADRIARQVAHGLDPQLLHEPHAVRQAFLGELAGLVACAAIGSKSPDHRPLTVALVGSTGVGKTTTLAKLAAISKLQDSRSVGLVTADTYRIAAVDQLRTYADIVGLPVHVARTPVEMLDAAHNLRDRDLVLIDTAGRGQRDAPRIAELRRFLRAAEPHETHLVLAATGSEKLLLEEWEAFAPLGVDRIMLTKLDQAVSFGPLFNVLHRIKKPVSYLATGQEVPRHLEPARVRRLAEMLLDGELHA